MVAHAHSDHWFAQFADSPSFNGIGTFGGPDAFSAFRRLLENSPARHLTLEDFEPDPAECRLDRVVMVLIDRWEGLSDGLSMSKGADVCSECGGTGKYVGLDCVEPCRLCCGKVRAP